MSQPIATLLILLDEHIANTSETLLKGLLIIFLSACLYFLPWIVARSRRKRNSAAIGVLNLFLGWTVIGWIVALVWAAMVDAPSHAEQRKAAIG